MRVIYKHNVFEVKDAWVSGKHLVFKDLDNVRHHTKDYFAENIALCALNDLAVNGYIRVDAWEYYD